MVIEPESHSNPGWCAHARLTKPELGLDAALSDHILLTSCLTLVARLGVRLAHLAVWLIQSGGAVPAGTAWVRSLARVPHH